MREHDDEINVSTRALLVIEAARRDPSDTVVDLLRDELRALAPRIDLADLPEPVANLLYQLKLKLLALESGVNSIVTEVGQIIIRADTLQHIDRSGLERRLGFLAPADVTIVSDRRETRPWGLAGGGPGKPGENLLLSGGRRQRLPPPSLDS